MLSQSTLVLLASMAVTALAGVSTPLEVRAATSCTTPKGTGTCGSTSGACSGIFIAGFCPGDDTNQCCVTTPVKCSTPDGDGLCANTAKTCAGFYSAGFCPGADNVQCCVPSAPDGPDNPATDGDEGSDEVTEDVPDATVVSELAAFDAADAADTATLSAQGLSASAIAAKKNKGQLIYAAAARWLGYPYRLGAGQCSGPTNGHFDCSGLVLHAVCKVTGKHLPHKAQLQYHSSQGRHYPLSQKKQGDAIFWSSTGNCRTHVTHVGIVKDGTHFIAAPHSGANVRVSKIYPTGLCPSVVRFY